MCLVTCKTLLLLVALICPVIILIYPLVVIVCPFVCLLVVRVCPPAVFVCPLVVLVWTFVCPLVILVVLSVGLFITGLFIKGDL